MAIVLFIILLNIISISTENYSPIHHQLKTYQVVPISFGNDDGRYDLQFTAFDRTFHAYLTSEEPQMRNMTIHRSDGVEENIFTKDFDHVYVEGQILHDYKSRVQGILELTKDNEVKMFKGIIFTGYRESYIIEPAKDLLIRGNASDVVVYRLKDVMDPPCVEDGCGEFRYDHIDENPDNTPKRLSGEHIKTLMNSDLNNLLKKFAHKSCSVEIVVDQAMIHAYDNRTNRLVFDLTLMIKMADSIFRSVDLDFDGKPNNIGLLFRKLTIYRKTFSSAVGNKTDPSRYLFECAHHNSPFCLSICMTSQPAQGIRAIAPVPDINKTEDGYKVGVCAHTRTDKKNKPYKLNTIFINMFNLTMANLLRIFAHQIGHTFGAQHDTAVPECYQSNRQGHYIMYNQSSNFQSGPNAVQFTICSIRDFQKILSVQNDCFEPVVSAHCGNALVEPPERCDCGMVEMCDLIDPCCLPQGGSGRRGCVLRFGSECSQKTDEDCCEQNCRFSPKGDFCKTGKRKECHIPPLCKGDSLECLPTDMSPNGTTCGPNGEFTCLSGLCLSNVCRDLGYPTCECPTIDKKCHLCCLIGDATCVLASILIDIQPVVFSAGRECDGLRGYCNDRGECIGKDNPEYGIFTTLNMTTDSLSTTTEPIDNNTTTTTTISSTNISTTSKSTIRPRPPLGTIYATNATSTLVPKHETGWSFWYWIHIVNTVLFILIVICFATAIHKRGQEPKS